MAAGKGRVRGLGLALLLALPAAAAADTTPPTTPVVTDDGLYTGSSNVLHAAWSSSDPESGIVEYQYRVRQKSVTGPIVAPWTSVGAATEVTATGFISLIGKTRVNGLLHNTYYFFQVKARNGVGLWSAVGASDGILVDLTPPGPVTVTDDGATTFSATQLHAIWTAAEDPESGIAGYAYQVVRDWTGGPLVHTGSTTAENRELAITNLALTPGVTYFFLIYPGNNASRVSGPFASDGIRVEVQDETPPSAPGQPTEESPDQDIDGDGSFTVHWPAAADPETGIAAYEVQQRTGTLGSWLSLGNNFPGTSASAGGTDGNTYFFRVRAKNGAGFWSVFSPVSDGITVTLQPAQISNISVTNITPDRAVVSWVTDQPATTEVDYGPTAAYGQTITDLELTMAVRGVTLTPLLFSTTYHFRVRSVNAVGYVTQSGDQTFQTPALGPSVVSVSGRQLLVQRRNLDGTLAPATPYVIRGVNWSPASKDTATTPADPNNANVRRPEFGKWYPTDLPLMKAMNVNTVRLFIDPGVDATLGPLGRQILDECYRQGIMVIMTVDDASNQVARIPQVVNYYKDHPAILLWSLGSEWNINRYFRSVDFPTVLSAAQATESAAALIKTLDTGHLVVSSYGEIDIDAAGLRLADTQAYVNTICPSVDIWSLNIYRGYTFRDLFIQWASITTKPMFVGEFGVDAFHATTLTHTSPPGFVEEAAQAQWDLSQWNDIVRHLSAGDAMQVPLGGTLFEWNDEWWKDANGSPWQQNTGGWFSGGFPDGMGNEEYFGLVDIERTPRQAYATLQSAFDPAYMPPPQVITLQASSEGGSIPNVYSYGAARLYEDWLLFYLRYGGAGGGRGFNVAAINAATGELLGPVQNFDLWGGAATAANALVNFLNSQPAGTVLVLAVADEAGLTLFPPNSCAPKSYSESVFQALEALGSAQIRGYCYRDSWAMVTVKGETNARSEQLGKGIPASAQTTVTLPQ